MPRLTAEQQGALQRVHSYLERLLKQVSPEQSRRMAVQYWGSTAGWRQVPSEQTRRRDAQYWGSPARWRKVSPEQGRRMAVRDWSPATGWRKAATVLRPSGEHAELLVANAEKDPSAWEAARTLATWMLKRDGSLPPVLAEFVAAVLPGDVRHPKETADVFTTLSRDLPLCMAVSMLLDAKFSLSDGDLYAIAEVSRMADELGHPIGTDMLAKVWGRYRAHVEAVRADGPFYFREEPGNFPLSRPPTRPSRSKVRQK